MSTQLRRTGTGACVQARVVRFALLCFAAAECDPEDLPSGTVPDAATHRAPPACEHHMRYMGRVAAAASCCALDGVPKEPQRAERVVDEHAAPGRQLYDEDGLGNQPWKEHTEHAT
jgi:hypothetical protein